MVFTNVECSGGMEFLHCGMAIPETVELAFGIVGCDGLSLPPVWSGYLAAERYLYMASIGWVIALVFWASNQVDMKSLKMPLIFVFCVAPIHFLRATVWSSDKALFDHATHVLPVGYSWHLRGMVALRAGEVEESIRFFQQAVQCERPHYLDRELVLQGLIHTEQFTQALNWAEEGPKKVIQVLFRTFG